MWGIFSTFCLFGVFFILTRRLKVPLWRVVVLAILYWGLWVIQALDGQVVVPILFFTLWFATEKKPSFGLTCATPILLSTKIFTELPALLRWKDFYRTRVLAIGLLSVLTLSLISAVMSFNGNAFEMFHSWSVAAQSGATALNPGQTHGPKNQSLSILLCRALGVTPEHAQLEVWISILLYLGFWFVFRKSIRRMSRETAWLWALAAVPIFHPLPWHHLYVFTFPLAAVVVSEWEQLKRRDRWLAFLGIALIALSAKRAWVFGLGETLEFYCGRAWGALLLVSVRRTSR
jgi:hypothetical protein